MQNRISTVKFGLPRNEIEVVQNDNFYYLSASTTAAARWDTFANIAGNNFQVPAGYIGYLIGVRCRLASGAAVNWQVGFSPAAVNDTGTTPSGAIEINWAFTDVASGVGDVVEHGVFMRIPPLQYPFVHSTAGGGVDCSGFLILRRLNG